MAKKKQSPGAKVETMAKALISNLPVLKGVDVRTGRPDDTAEDDGQEAQIDTPTCDLWSTEVRVVPELEDEWECNLHVRLTVQADDEGATDLDNRVVDVQNQLSFPEDVKPLVNFPLASRPVPDLFLQDIYIVGEPTTTHDRYYRTEITFLVKFRDDNGQG